MSDQANTISQEHLMPLMMDYATGALDEGLALVMASYISMSPYARDQLLYLEGIGGALLCQDCSPEEMRQSSLTNVMARLDDYLEQVENNPATSLEQAHMDATLVEIDVPCDIPQTISRHITTHTPKKPKWAKIYPGIKAMKIPLSKSCGDQVYLYKIDPATKTPEHTHRGLEMTLVLDGAVIDETGTHGAGNIIIHDEHVHHQPIACPERGCICLVATNAPLKFTRGFMRLLNPFL